LDHQNSLHNANPLNGDYLVILVMGDFGIN
jgi:hypothetical protein